MFHDFSNYDCHSLFRKLVDKTNDQVKVNFIPKTNEQCVSVTHGCIRFWEVYRIFSKSLDSLVETTVDNNHKTLENLKKETVEYDEMLKFVIEKREEDGNFYYLRNDRPDKNDKLGKCFL